MAKRRRKWRDGRVKLSLFSKEHVYRVKMLVQPNRGYDWLTERVLVYPFNSNETRNIRIKRIKNPNWEMILRTNWWQVYDPVYMVTFTTMISNFSLESVKNNKNIISLELLK